MMLRFNIFLLMLLALAAPAHAETDRAEIRRQLISSCKFWGTCGQYFRKHRYRERHIELRSWYEDSRRWRDDRWGWRWDPRYERRPVERAQREWERYTSSDPSYKRFRQCHDRIIEVLSGQHKSEEVAMRDAWTMWVANIQFERGALYQEPNNSVQRWSVCAPTDISDTVTGVVSRFGGKVYGAVRKSVTGKDDVRDDGRNMRCRLWARACPELPEPAETTDEVREGRQQDRRQSRRRQQ